MKKIAIISAINTCHGTLLQAYATQKTIEKFGLESKIFYYRSNPVKQLYRIFNIPFLITKLKEKAIPLYTKIKHKSIYYKIKDREEKFDEFRKNKLKLTEKIVDKEELKRLVKSYDGVVLGSDQVWNPQNLEMDYYTLNFVPDSMAKITLAPSFGVSEIPKSQISKTKEYLSRIQYISVREEAGSKIVKELIDRDVPVVCDPTSLLTTDEWDLIVDNKPLIKEKYVLCYFMSGNEIKRNFSLRFAKEKGLKIVSLPLMDEYNEDDVEFGDIQLYDSDPSDFINLIKNAQFVLTDSFHCMMFSIYYKKKFYIFNRSKNNSKTSVNSRIDSICNKLNIQQRRLSGNENINSLNDDINWENIHNCLDNLRKYTNNYLVKALEEGKLIK